MFYCYARYLKKSSMNLAKRKIISDVRRYIKGQIFEFLKGWIFFALLQLYVIWLISVIHRTFSWHTSDSHGFFNAFLIYIIMCTTCSRFHLSYSEFICLCSDFLYWWNDCVALCSMSDLPLLKTLTYLSFHVKRPYHWTYWFVDSISPMVAYLYSVQPTYIKIKLFFE